MVTAGPLRIVARGQPAPKGSLRYVGGRRRLVEDNAATYPWRHTVGWAARAAAGGRVLTGPVSVGITVTLTPPASASGRVWPWKQSPGHGDSDKLARTILDAIEDAGVVANDAAVCRLSVVKCYPRSPAPDALPSAGAVIVLDELEP